MSYRVRKRSAISRARVGSMATQHGRFQTPAFMPIATRGAVKALTGQDLRDLGAEIILSNTYHLFQRPGLTVLRRAGGLHTFMDWSGPILTDSGGFQVFSLAKHRQISERGVTFRDPVTGQKHLLTPESSLRIQDVIGSDIRMVLDELVGYPVEQDSAGEAVERTTRWAKRSLRPAQRSKNLTFAIIQGSTDLKLRAASLAQLRELPFDGFALGGLAVGEPEESLWPVIETFAGQLPADKPRYIMGFGRPEQIVRAVRAGADMFDCVIPTRNARHGLLYVWKPSATKASFRFSAKPFYDEVRIGRSIWANRQRPLDPRCSCLTCKTYSVSYLHHLFRVGDPLALRLASLHNVRFYLSLMEKIRRQIMAGYF